MRTVPEDGAPISLLKFSDSIQGQQAPGDILALIDQTMSGFVNDDPERLDITIEAREQQAQWYLEEGLPLTEDLKRHLTYMYEDTKPDIEALWKFGKTNAELKQLVGLIQLFGWSMRDAAKHGVRLKFRIEEPETRLDPKRTARVMSLIYKLRDEYGIKQDK